jgi:hypothetical protein
VAKVRPNWNPSISISSTSSIPNAFSGPAHAAMLKVFDFRVFSFAPVALS